MKSKVFLSMVAIVLAFTLFTVVPAHSASAQTTYSEHAMKPDSANVDITWWDYGNVYHTSYFSNCGYEGIYLTSVAQVTIPGPYSGWFLYYHGGPGQKRYFNPGNVITLSFTDHTYLVTQLQINC